jgi:hypothetical protein
MNEQLLCDSYGHGFLSHFDTCRMLTNDINCEVSLAALPLTAQLAQATTVVCEQASSEWSSGRSVLGARTRGCKISTFLLPSLSVYVLLSETTVHGDCMALCCT